MRVAINGLGRIGRLVLKIGLEKGVNIVAINDLVPLKNLVYLLKYDSVYGTYDKKIRAGKDFLQIGDKRIKVFSESDPEKLPWKQLGIHTVIESTGFFTDRNSAEKHLKAGAKKVVISAPGKNPDVTIVLGVNDNKLKKNHKMISMASCTTNCLAPIAKILHDKFKIEKGFLTTVHAYTSSQQMVDTSNEKLRRGRAGAINIIPTTTGATKAVIEVIPELKGKLDGLAIRVPVACGSIVDFVVKLRKSADRKKINDIFKRAADKDFKGILQYSEDELVSSDIIKNPHSSIVDGLSTQVLGGFVKILSWYDNEYGYSCRMIDLLKKLK